MGLVYLSLPATLLLCGLNFMVGKQVKLAISFKEGPFFILCVELAIFLPQILIVFYSPSEYPSWLWIALCIGTFMFSIPAFLLGALVRKVHSMRKTHSSDK